MATLQRYEDWVKDGRWNTARDKVLFSAMMEPRALAYVDPEMDYKIHIDTAVYTAATVLTMDDKPIWHLQIPAKQGKSSCATEKKGAVRILRRMTKWFPKPKQIFMDNMAAVIQLRKEWPDTLSIELQPTIQWLAGKLNQADKGTRLSKTPKEKMKQTTKRNTDLPAMDEDLNWRSSKDKIPKDKIPKDENNWRQTHTHTGRKSQVNAKVSQSQENAHVFHMILLNYYYQH